MLTLMDSLIVLHRAAVTVQCVTGAISATFGAQHIWEQAAKGIDPILSKGTQPVLVEVVIGLVVLLPSLLVMASVPPMVRGRYIAFRSGASATGVLLVALVGLLSLFGSVVTLKLSLLVLADLALIGIFGETRRRRRLSPRGLPPGL